jgi:hypothetical protein
VKPYLDELKRKGIINGCGAKNSIIKVPNFIFKASCNQHDFYYWRGNTEELRKYADDTFYELMKEDIKEVKGFFKKAHYHIWAYTYYKAVRLEGHKHFNYGRLKTIEDIDKWKR